MLKYVSILSLIYMLCACHTAHKTAATVPGVQSKTGSYLTNHQEFTDADIKETQKFMEAQKSEILGDAQQAMNLYQEVVKMDPANDAAWYEMSRIHLKGYRYPQALSAAANAYHLDGTNKWYAGQLAESYAAQSRFKDAAAVYSAYLNKYPDNAEMYYEWALMMQQSKNLAGAIDVYNKLEKITGIDENEIGEKQKLYLQMGKPDKAAAEVQKLCDAYPGNTDYLGMLANMYAEAGNFPKAVEIVKHIIELSPMNDRAYLVLSEYYRQMGKEDESQAMLKKAFANPLLSPDIKIRFIIDKMQHGENRNTIDALCKTLVSTHPDNTSVHEFMGSYLLAQKKDSLAYNEYLIASKLSNPSADVWHEMITYNSEKAHKDSAVYYSIKYINAYPKNIDAYYCTGISFYEAKKYDSSLTYLSRGLALGSDNKLLLAQMYSTEGEIFHTQNKFHESDSAYDQALLFNPDDAFTLNNYAYYLSIRNKDLDKAASMSRKSNLLQPNEPSFLDTYGWILYKQGKVDEAKEYIKKAIDKGGDKHADVLEHYGDVLYKSGDIDNAVEYWKKARALHPDDATQLDKKIADKKSYE